MTSRSISTSLFLAAGLAAAIGGCTESVLAPEDSSTLNRLTPLVAAERPIEEFVHAQGTMINADDFRSALEFGALSWYDRTKNMTASVDYAGAIYRAYSETRPVEDGSEMPQGPKYWGTIQEIPLSNGTARVIVELNTAYANAYAALGPGPVAGPVVFGSRNPDNPGKVMGMARSTLRVAFRNSRPGAPLPDLVQLISAPMPGQQFEWITFRAEAEAVDGETGATRTLLVDAPRYSPWMPRIGPIGTLPATLELGGVVVDDAGEEDVVLAVE